MNVPPKPSALEGLTPSALRSALGRRPRVELPALPGRTNHLRCGVLVPLRWAEGPEVLLTRRAPTLKHGGEWCFPGGRPEVGDADLYATACREGHEELGLSEVQRLGRLSSMPIGTSDYRLEPFVVAVDQREFSPDPSEVAEVAALPLLELISQEELPSLPFQWQGRPQRSPLFPLRSGYVFGATAHTLMELIRIAAPLVGSRPPRLVSAELSWEEIVASVRA